MSIAGKGSIVSIQIVKGLSWEKKEEGKRRKEHTQSKRHKK